MDCHRAVVLQHRELLCAELAKEEQDCACHGRCGAITPDGIIDEDFEEVLGSPSQV